MKCDVSIIIVSYNTREMTIDCIKSVIEQTKQVTYELIVLDNNSSDGSAEAIAKEFPSINVIALHDNIGFARANNFSAKEAKGKYLLLLNPDTVILDHAIDKIVSFAESWKDESIFGGRTYYGNGKLNPTSSWKKPTLWSLFCFAFGLTVIFKGNRFFDPESYGGWQRDTIKNVDIVTGCFLLLKKQTWDKLNGFSPDFFMYAEDADLCIRALEFGIQPVIYPDAKIIHYGGASEKIPADKMVRLLKAKVLLIHKHWKVKQFVWLGVFFYLTAAFIRARIPIKFSFAAEKISLWREIWDRREEWAFNK